MDISTFTIIASAALAGLFTTLFWSWFKMSQSRKREGSQANQLFHHPGFFVLAFLSTLITIGIPAYISIFEESSKHKYLAMAMVPFAIVSIWMLLAYFLDRHEVSETGMRTTTAAGRRLDFEWKDVKSVTTADAMGYFILNLAHGQKARISFMLVGLPQFATQVLKHVPESALSEQCANLLKDTAKGISPVQLG